MTYTCKFCNKSGLIWKDIEGKWKLFDKTGGKHYCFKKEELKPLEPKSFRNDPLIKKALDKFRKQLRKEKR